MSGRPPTEVTAKLWVTPLRRPSRPVSREAREGEQVEAAAWKSTNLHRKESDRHLSNHRKPNPEKTQFPLSSGHSSVGEKLQRHPATEQIRKMKPREVM